MMRNFLGILAVCALASVATGSPSAAAPGIVSLTITPTPAVVGSPATFTVVATGTNLTFQWTFGDGTVIPYSPSNASVTHQYSQPGHYNVTIEVQEPGLPPTFATLTRMLQVHYPLKTPRPTHSNTILLDSVRGKVWCVNIDSDTVARVDVTTHLKDAEVAVGQTPRSLAQAGDGTIWVVSQQHPSINVIHPDSATLLHVIPLPHGSLPYGIAMSPDGAYAFVSLQGTGGVRKFSVATRTQTASAAQPPKARGVAVTSDGRVLVTRFVSPAMTGQVEEYSAADLTPIRTHNLAFDPGDTVALGMGLDPDTGVKGRGVPNYITSLAITPDEREVWIPSKKDNTVRGTAPGHDLRLLDFERTVRTTASVIDLGANVEDLSRRIDIDNSDMAQYIEFSPTGDLMFVSLQGSNRIIVLDRFANNAPKANIITQALLNPFPHPPDNPPAGYFTTQTGLAPQGMVVDGVSKKLFVNNYMSRTMMVFDMTAFLNFDFSVNAPLLATTSTRAVELMSPSVFRGKQIFYNSGDLRMSRDQYLACSTCHLDGGSDQRVWDFTQRGEGIRNTTNLQGRGGVAQGFVHWSANFDEIQDFENDMRNGFGGTGYMTNAQFAATTATYTGTRKTGVSVELDKLAAYVTSLTKVSRSPFRNADGTLTAAGARGEALFKQLDCQSCHGGPRFADSTVPPAVLPNPPAPPGGGAGTLNLHDVGTLKNTSGQRLNGGVNSLYGIDTPTLKGVWEGAPYFHDGSAITIMDVMNDPSNVLHGGIDTLSMTERQDLAQYMLEIDELDAPPVPMGQVNTISIASVSTGRPYSLATAAQDRLPFVDRSYTITTNVGAIPALNNKVLLRTSEDDKNVTTANHVTLTLTGTCDVYVFFDSRATSLPTWLTASWTPSPAENLTISPGVTMNAHVRVGATGTVTLGGNGGVGALRNYFVIINQTSPLPVFEEGPISQGEWAHVRDADGDGLEDEFEAITIPAINTISPFDFDSISAGTADEDRPNGAGVTLFTAQIAFLTPVVAGGGGSSGGCGLGGLEFLLPLLALRLMRRRRR
jgi:hypothetical protein